MFRDIDSHGNSSKDGFAVMGDDLVFIDSEFHHHQGDDRHGLNIRSAQRVWIMNSHFHHNGGDGIQGCHNCDNPPQDIYIGKNLFHSDRENAVDFKIMNGSTVSENVMYGYRDTNPGQNFCFDDGSKCGSNWSSGSDGAAIVIGSDGEPTNIVIHKNEIYDSRHAMRIEKSNGTIISDNNIHDIVGQCLKLEKNGYDTVWTGNTCKNAGRGIFQFWRDQFSLTVAGNVWENISGPVIEYESRSVCEAGTITGNTFTNTGPYICGNDTHADINSGPGASGNTVN